MKPIKMLRNGAALAFLLASLTACGNKQLVKTDTVEVERPVIVGVPAELVRVPAEPKLPPGELTNDDLADMIDRLRAWGRGMAGQLRKIGGLHEGDGAGE